jgi:hypothetical protein
MNATSKLIILLKEFGLEMKKITNYTLPKILFVFLIQQFKIKSIIIFLYSLKEPF